MNREAGRSVNLALIVRSGIAATVLLTLAACGAPRTTPGNDVSDTGTSAATSSVRSLSPTSSAMTGGPDTAPFSALTSAATASVLSSATRGPTPRPVTPTPAASTTSPPAQAIYGIPSRPIRVQLTGQVLKGPHNVVMCPPYATALTGTLSQGTPTPDCSHPIPVSGADLNPTHLTLAGHNATHSWGQTHIEAMWNGRTLTATSQRRPTSGDQDRADHLLPTAVGCPAPAGGWKLGAVQDDDAIANIGQAVGADFGALALGYPHGGPTDEGGTNPSYGLQDTEQVLVVGVTGSIPTATAAIRKLFRGNLCVVHTDANGADVNRQSTKIRSTFDGRWDNYGVISTGGRVPTLGTETNQIDVVVRTPELDKLIASIPGPAITINPWIKPTG